MHSKIIYKTPHFSTHLVCDLELCLQKKCDVGYELAANKSEDSCCPPCGKSTYHSVDLNVKQLAVLQKKKKEKKMSHSYQVAPFESML